MHEIVTVMVENVDSLMWQGSLAPLKGAQSLLSVAVPYSFCVHKVTCSKINVRFKNFVVFWTPVHVLPEKTFGKNPKTMKFTVFYLKVHSCALMS